MLLLLLSLFAPLISYFFSFFVAFVVCLLKKMEIDTVFFVCSVLRVPASVQLSPDIVFVSSFDAPISALTKDTVPAHHLKNIVCKWACVCVWLIAIKVLLIASFLLVNKKW